MDKSMSMFRIVKRVAFSDTDAMGVVHHSQYVRYFEEARVAWLRERNLISYHYPYSPVCFAVLESHCYHERSMRFDQEFEVCTVVRHEKIKIRFRYAIYVDGGQMRVATGETLLLPVNQQIKPVRLDKTMIKQMEEEPWIEIWPSNWLGSQRPLL